MAYDEGLAQRIHEILDETAPGRWIGKKMFGGIAFLVSGNMACGIIKEDLIVRVGPDAYTDCLKRPHVSVFDITGRPMKGWVMIEPDGFESDSSLAAWVAAGVNFAETLPPK